MKICIPTEEQNGLASLALRSLGSAPYFII